MSANDPKFPTRDALREAGFKQNNTHIWTLCDTEKLFVKASEETGRRYCPIIRVFGFVATRARMAEVDEEIPEMSDSREQALAYLRHALEPILSIVFPEGKSEPTWLTVGLLNRDLLPWEQRIAALKKLPSCHVSRDWARLALRTLAAQIDLEQVATSVTFKFDGEILIIRCGSNVVVAPATGKPWDGEVGVALTVLNQLPKRLMRSEVTFSASEDSFTIGSWRYPRNDTQPAPQNAPTTVQTTG